MLCDMVFSVRGVLPQDLSSIGPAGFAASGRVSPAHLSLLDEARDLESISRPCAAFEFHFLLVLVVSSLHFGLNAAMAVKIAVGQAKGVLVAFILLALFHIYGMTRVWNAILVWLENHNAALIRFITRLVVLGLAAVPIDSATISADATGGDATSFPGVGHALRPAVVATSCRRGKSS
jgi:hypothetical protein